MNAPSVSVSDIRYTSITYTWSASALAEKLQYVVANHNLSDSELEDSAQDMAISEHSYTATGLNANSLCNFYIRAVKGDQKTAWTKTQSYTLYRGNGLGATTRIWWTEITWSEQKYASEAQLIISETNLSEDQLESYPESNRINVSLKPTIYTFYGDYNTTYHAYLRIKYDDIGYDSWAHEEFTTGLPTPIKLHVTNHSSTGFTVKWDHDKTHAVLVSNQSNLSNEQLNSMAYELNDEGEYTVSGLAPNETVYFYITKSHDDTHGRATRWARYCISAKPAVDETITVSNDVPFIEDFNDAAPLWSTIATDNTYWAIADGSNRNETAIIKTQAFEGEQNICFINASPSSDPNTSELISPVLNIDGVTNPILTFYYGIYRWNTDYDNLEVNYRLSPASEWKNLMSVDTYNDQWDFVSVNLPETSPTLQIEFKGTNGYGYGVMIDKLRVQSANYTQISQQATAGNGAKIYAGKNCIHVQGAIGGVTVTTLTGQTIATAKGEDALIHVAQGGIYLVHTGGLTCKVLVP
ncbi:MAG: hypothetical protein J5808_04340 [Paludibacteraceae bacterium]|nr:hypothetical protein [Paludibacteraceae bacterium]